jgi:hypothetical protein
MPRTRAVLIASIAAAVALTACSSSKSATSATTTAPATSSAAASTSTQPPVATSPGPPTTTAIGVRIVSFTGPRPPVTCNAPTSMQIDFETQNAKSVTLSINGGGVFATYTDGAHDELVPLTCAGSPQKYVLSAHGANGATVSKTLTVQPRVLATS